MDKFGLIGRNISYSFSKDYFERKFKNEDISNAIYENYDIDDISKLKEVLKQNPELKGLNVTIPYKEEVLPFLDSINKKAKKIGAVNTLKITKKGKLKGYNTDCYGFKKALTPHLKLKHKRALILGTGGASKAVAYTLKRLHIKYEFVSRKPTKTAKFTYQSLTGNMISKHLVIINCTPLGTFPKVESYPNIPYNAITENHILFDLIYNPTQTRFLELGAKQNALTLNGLKMLKYQAEKAWLIWNH
jgi:shikimate dehydrogenase